MDEPNVDMLQRARPTTLTEPLDTMPLAHNRDRKAEPARAFLASAIESTSICQ
jgi:hypothetical protein